MKKYLFLLFASCLWGQTGGIVLMWEPYDLIENHTAAYLAVIDSTTGKELKEISISSEEFSRSAIFVEIECDSAIHEYTFYMVAKTIGRISGESSNSVTCASPLYAEEYNVTGPNPPEGLTARPIHPSRLVIANLKMINGSDDFTLSFYGNQNIVRSFMLSSGGGIIDWLTGEPSLGGNNDGLNSKSVKIDSFRPVWNGNFGGDYVPDIRAYSVTGTIFNEYKYWDGITFKKIFVLK